MCQLSPPSLNCESENHTPTLDEEKHIISSQRTPVSETI